MGTFFPIGHDVLGTLSLETVLEYYDGPALFFARNELDHTFLAVAVEESESAERFLYVPVSARRRRAIEVGEKSLREAFEHPERPDWFLVSVEREGTTSVMRLGRDGIEKEWLPESGEFLSYSVPTAPAFSIDELLIDASEQHRPVVGIEVSQSQSGSRTEYPLRFAGPILTEFQELTDSLGEQVDFALAGLRAASFVFIVAPMDPDRLIQYPSPTLDKVQELVAAASSPDDFAQMASELKARPRSHVRDLFNALSDANTGIRMVTAFPSGTVRDAAATLEAIRAGLGVLRSQPDGDVEIIQLRCNLIGLNHVRRTFSVRETGPTGGRKAPRRFSGKIDSSVNIEGVPSGESIEFDATISRERVRSDTGIGESTFKNRLTALNLVSQTQDDLAGSQIDSD